ncbi:LON peptidase substrate-binding domain-containing protein [Adhaeribacter radiodurans]|uniref:LON peptidase substrate-binding domain-containing protein n=1 Tax=Adhaeribacter radiodurans TaxID=2745197 RepID=A0A7L7L7N9_9BACT|nr:LON peptidase substrate-binding domain-containing protein [Adhaeribacter radiodurans]QMU28389.1 LON peptidase substrate-binding domain-containing protein [Adhaeribacter radiodurans]
MANFLPLFPLNIVVYPGEKINLHIFEPRYKQLVEDCFAAGKPFGIPAFLKKGVSEIGTEVNVQSIDKTYPGGEMDIKCKGGNLFRIINFYRQLPFKLYAGGEVEVLQDTDDEDSIMKVQIQEKIQHLYEILGLATLYINLPENFKIYDIAHQLGLTLEQEYILLQFRRESKRQEMVLAHLIAILPVIEQTERLKERVKLNGHFKNLIPPNF